MRTLKTPTLLITLFLLTSLQSQAQDGWGEVQKVAALERYASQKLGSAIDMDGDYAVSGSDYLNDAYVFEKDADGNWFQAQHLVSPDDNYNDLFGNAVAISGNTILIGARSHDYDSNNANNMSGAGAVYVYQRDNLGVWNYVQKITPDDRTVGNGFGHVLDIDGDRAVLGVWVQSTDQNGENALVSAGAAYIFERDNSGTWAQAQKIVASDRATYDYFGRDGLGISGDYAVVGAQYEDQNELGLDTLSQAGSAYIFKRNPNGDWNEVQKVVASDREEGEWFGHAIAIDGSQMVIASNQAGIQPPNDYNAKRGAAYTFELDENNVWVETQIISASDAKGFDEFGSSIALDGNTIIVGVPGRNYTFQGVYYPDMGAAYVYEKDGAGAWNQVQRMQGLDSDQGDNFGYSVAISGDLAMAGAYLQNFDENGANNISDAGAIYVFDELAEPLVSPYECPYLEANIGDTCDDGDENTAGDVVTEDCECLGTMLYDCPDLSANIGDTCDDGDENTVGDVVTEDCECLGTMLYDCPGLSANIGDTCDDGDPNTHHDTITVDCTCIGTACIDPQPAATGMWVEYLVNQGMLGHWNPVEGSIGCQHRLYAADSTLLYSEYQEEPEADSNLGGAYLFDYGTTYTWALRCGCSTDPFVVGPWSYVSFTTPEANSPTSELVCFPNPTTGVSNTRFHVNNQQYVRLELYNMDGRVVRKIFTGMANPETTYEFSYDVRGLPEGVYVYKLTAETRVRIQKFILTK